MSPFIYKLFYAVLNASGACPGIHVAKFPPSIKVGKAAGDIAFGPIAPILINPEFCTIQFTKLAVANPTPFTFTPVGPISKTELGIPATGVPPVIVTVPVLVKSGGGVVNQQSSSTTVASTGGGSGNDPYEVLDFQG